MSLFARLAELGIASVTVEHAPMFTVEQSAALRGSLPGAHTKTLSWSTETAAWCRCRQGRQQASI
jgi:hypothetical protein